MTYEENFSALKKLAEAIDVSDVKGHFAYQFDITGDGEGIFYVEIKDGKINAEPYDYKDNNAVIEGTADEFEKFFKGENTDIKVISGDASELALAAKKAVKIAAEAKKEKLNETINRANKKAASTTKKTAKKISGSSHPTGHKKPTKKEREAKNRK